MNRVAYTRMPDRHPLSLPLVVAILAAILFIGPLSACGGDESERVDPSGSPATLTVLTTATFLADIAQNVAGERATVRSLVARDADPHAYEATPGDLAAVARADLFILNGEGLEGTLENTLRSAAEKTTFVIASQGLTPRTPQADEPAHGPDPHYWLDPTLVIAYVENLRDAFTQADPAGAAVYRANAAAYTAELHKLDRWIEAQVRTLSPSERVLVMNHISHGYYADRYGFHIVGAIIPGVSAEDTPTAQQLAALSAAISREHVRALFVESGENPGLAKQIARETGARVVDDLRDHTLSEPGQGAATYIEMMKYDTRRIVTALGR